MLPSVSTLRGNFTLWQYSLNWPLSKRRQQTPWTLRSGVGASGVKKRVSSSTVLFTEATNHMMKVLRVRLMSQDEQRGESIFSSLLMYYTVLFLSFGPLSVAELPCVEFIKHQKCQLSQKPPHHRAARGSLRENLWHSFKPNLLKLFGLP